jgi:hypothetical protein
VYLADGEKMILTPAIENGTLYPGNKARVTGVKLQYSGGANGSAVSETSANIKNFKDTSQCGISVSYDASAKKIAVTGGFSNASSTNDSLAQSDYVGTVTVEWRYYNGGKTPYQTTVTYLLWFHQYWRKFN